MTANHESRDKMASHGNRLSGLLVCSMPETEGRYRHDMFRTIINNIIAQLLTKYLKNINSVVIEFNKETLPH